MEQLNDQAEYDRLVEEIIINENLDTSDRLKFYDLHRQNIRRRKRVLYKLVNNLIDRQRKNYIYVIDREEELRLYEILEQKRGLEGLNRYEYNYLCFLITKHRLSSHANTPCLPTISEISFEVFKEQYAFNEERVKLYQTLINALQQMLIQYKVDEARIIVGGSFLDKGKQQPGDIDLTILLPRQIFLQQINPKILNRIIGMFKDGEIVRIDLMELPLDYDFNFYMPYEQITLLSNTPNVHLVEEDDLAKMVAYRCREIFRLNYRPGINQI